MDGIECDVCLWCVGCGAGVRCWCSLCCVVWCMMCDNNV